MRDPDRDQSYLATFGALALRMVNLATSELNPVFDTVRVSNSQGSWCRGVTTGASLTDAVPGDVEEVMHRVVD